MFLQTTWSIKVKTWAHTKTQYGWKQDKNIKEKIYGKNDIKKRIKKNLILGIKFLKHFRH